MPTVTVGDRRLSYESSGNGENRLLFVHGFRNSCQSWSLIRDRLDPTRFSSWYLDLPGCGRSSRPARWQECTIERYADDVQQFCSSLGLHDVVLIGHSLGGAVAMRVALDHPEVVRALVLVAPTAAEGIGYLTDDQLATLIRPSDEELASVVRAAFHQVPSEETFDRVMATVRSASPAHVEGAVRSQREFSVADRLGEISIPTLVVGGDRDRHVPIRYTLRTAAAIRRCAVQIYHNVGHAPFIEVPEEFTELLEEFVLDDLTG
jgi:pimeloyl-ACP methyl ester carboxylesterase